ncbi:hemolysin XhlA family protein [Paenibacillus sp. IHBB 10380]|uniref:hemolysin XhlA family protein n=1 Tax=Paenibacillus sp. IHBB 10380 TaxID=1566358 RepID=UPI0005CFAD98|nr:hemolysin XhlA family protein [Paenibacillus sp. IHBB 10380]AJS59193.1 hemolysin XhlA [Paenibacillus sp. IHBB 10380]
MDETTEILQRLTRVETKLDAQLYAKDIAQEALQSTKSAHRRLDEIEGNQKWLWRTIGGSAIAIVMAALVTAIKLGGL